MLDKSTLSHLRAGKNLLAFSAGVDSSALFFLLRDAGIAFDIAHVNYHTRTQSTDEEAHARRLAKQYNLRCHCLDAPKIRTNFEAEARTVRYTFFDRLVVQFGYDNLLTAHQLDDRFEWLLMQLSKGAGLPELLGMSAIEPRQHYTLIRPLLKQSKSDLKNWLDSKKYIYYEDATNADMTYQRNRIRHSYASAFLKTYKQGIRRTFDFLERDCNLLETTAAPAAMDTKILLLKMPLHRLSLMRQIDRWLKHRGYLLRQGEKERILHEDELVLGRRYALSISSFCTLVTPRSNSTMPKQFKEKCRLLGIGAKVRPYLLEHPAIFDAVSSQLAVWQREE